MTGSAEMLLLTPLVLLPPVLIVAGILFFVKRKEKKVETEAEGSKSRGLPLMAQNGSSSPTAKSRGLAMASSRSRSLPAADEFGGEPASSKRTKKRKKKRVGGGASEEAPEENIETKAEVPKIESVPSTESNDTSIQHVKNEVAAAKGGHKKRKKKRGGVKHKKASDEPDDKAEDDALEVAARGDEDEMEEKMADEESKEETRDTAPSTIPVEKDDDDDDGVMSREEKSRDLRILVDDESGPKDRAVHAAGQVCTGKEVERTKTTNLSHSVVNHTRGFDLNGESSTNHHGDGAAAEGQYAVISSRGHTPADEVAASHVNGHGKFGTVREQGQPIAHATMAASRELPRNGETKAGMSETDTVKQMIEFLSSGGHDRGTCMATPDDDDVMVLDDDEEEEKSAPTSRSLMIQPTQKEDGVKKIYDGNISQGAFAPTDEDQERELNKLAEELLPGVSEIMAELDTARSMSFGSDCDPSPLTPVRRTIQVDTKTLGAILEQRGLDGAAPPDGLVMQPTVDEEDDDANNHAHATDEVAKLRMSVFEKDAELAALRASLEDVEDRDGWARKKQTEKLATQHRELEKLSTQIEEKNLEILTLERRLEESVNYADQRKSEWEMEKESLSRTIRDLTHIAQSKKGGDGSLHAVKDDELRRLTLQLQEAKARTADVTGKWEADKRALQSAAEKVNQLEHAHKSQETLRRDLHNAQLEVARVDSLTQAAKVKDETIAKLSNEVMAATNKTQGFMAQLQAKESEVNRLMAQLKLAEDSARHIQTVKEQVKSNEDEEWEKRSVVQEKIHAFSQEIKDKDQEVARLTAKVDELNEKAHQVETLTIEVRKRDEEIIRLKGEHSAQNGARECETETLQSTLDEQTDEIEGLQQDAAETSEHAEKLRSMKDDLQQLTEEAKWYKLKNAEAEGELNRLKKELSVSIEAEKEKRISAEAGRRKAEDDAAARIDELEQQRDSDQAELAKLRMELFGPSHGLANGSSRGFSVDEVSQENVPPVPSSLDDPYSLQLVAYTLGSLPKSEGKQRMKVGDHWGSQHVFHHKQQPTRTSVIPLPASFDDPFDLQLATVVLGKTKVPGRRGSSEKGSRSGSEKAKTTKEKKVPTGINERGLCQGRSLPVPALDQAEDSSGAIVRTSGAVERSVAEGKTSSVKVAAENVAHGDRKAVPTFLQKRVAKKRPMPRSEVRSSLVSPTEGQFAFSDESSGLSLILNVLSAGKQHMMKAQGYTYQPIIEPARASENRKATFEATSDECLPAIVASDDDCGVGISDDASGLRLVMQLISKGAEKVKRKSTARKGVDSSSSASSNKHTKKKSEKQKKEKTNGEKEAKTVEKVATREVLSIEGMEEADEHPIRRKETSSRVLAPDGSKGFIFGDDGGGVGLVLQLLAPGRENLQPMPVTVAGDDPSVAQFTEEPYPRKRVIHKTPTCSELRRVNGNVGTVDDGVGLNLVLEVLSKGKELAPSSHAHETARASKKEALGESSKHRGETKVKKTETNHPVPAAKDEADKLGRSSRVLVNGSNPVVVRDDPHAVGFILDMFGAKGHFKNAPLSRTESRLVQEQETRYHRVSLPKFVRLSNRRSHAVGFDSVEKDDGEPVLKHFLVHGGNNAATFKSAVASVVYDVEIEAAPPSLEAEVPSLFQKPALIMARGETLASDEIAFGGNGIIKALAGISTSKPKLTLSEDSLVDEWLEFERGELRPEATAAMKSKSASYTAVGKIDSALQSKDGRGRHVVGENLTLADISIVSTLYCALRGEVSDSKKDDGAEDSPSILLSEAATCGLPESVVDYVQTHLRTKPFQRGKELFENKLAKQVRPKGLVPKGTTFLDDFATSRFALQLLQSRRHVESRTATTVAVEFL